MNPAEDRELPKLPASLPQTILTQKEAQRLMDGPELKSPIGYREFMGHSKLSTTQIYSKVTLEGLRKRYNYILAKNFPNNFSSYFGNKNNLEVDDALSVWYKLCGVCNLHSTSKE